MDPTLSLRLVPSSLDKTHIKKPEIIVTVSTDQKSIKDLFIFPDDLEGFVKLFVN